MVEMVVLVPGTRRPPGGEISPTGIFRVWRRVVVMGSYQGCWVATQGCWVDGRATGARPGVEPPRESGQEPTPGHSCGGWSGGLVQSVSGRGRRAHSSMPGGAPQLVRAPAPRSRVGTPTHC